MKTNLPKGLITPLEAKELNQQFVKTRSKDLNRIVKKESGNPKKEDAISSWFSLEELENYIAYVKEEGTKKGITVNGLRVYFGAYSNNVKKQDKKDLSTVFFAPTMAKPATLQKSSSLEVEGSSDIESIDALNGGTFGDPPSKEYPAT
ncbi:MAG: hypothetical protein QM495_01385 [Lutibacter sp.]|uniref:hypothetical protein n=1 Tax=Lutibacter sp. TaxID=1925666 RepID=UPI00385E5D99